MSIYSSWKHVEPTEGYYWKTEEISNFLHHKNWGIGNMKSSVGNPINPNINSSPNIDKSTKRTYMRDLI